MRNVIARSHRWFSFVVLLVSIAVFALASIWVWQKFMVEEIRTEEQFYSFLLSFLLIFLIIPIAAFAGSIYIARIYKRRYDAFKYSIRESDGIDPQLWEIYPELKDMYEEYVYNRNKLIQTEKNMQKIIMNNVIEAQEQERKRVSRELHDSIGQALYSILVGLKILKNLKVEQSMRDHMDEMVHLTSKAMDEVKRMAIELRPSALDDLGLVPAIRSYLDKYEQSFGIRVLFELQGKHTRYSPKVEIMIYRILQESLNNAAKYSGTPKVEVCFVNASDQLTISIKDYGKGFDPKENHQGVGLYSMKERAESINGTITLHSIPGSGTTIEVTVPLKEAQ